jgi:hypothetical protein
MEVMRGEIALVVVAIDVYRALCQRVSVDPPTKKN